MVPDGVYLDMDGLAEVDLGNGTNYNPAEALNMYFQTGSIVGRSLTQDGDMNPGKVPIQELTSSSGQGKIQSLISTYQYYLQMIRDVTGLNEARDGSTPDKQTLVGLQKMAANASNVATRHIKQAGLYITLRIAENIALKIADALQFPLTAESLANNISNYNVNTLVEIQNLNLHDFGIYLELEPDEEQQAQLEQNIQMALQQGDINLEDAIDLRQIKNLKLANQLLKVKRKLKAREDHKRAIEQTKAQAESQAQAAEEIAMAEVQKQEAISSSKVQYEQARSQMEIQRMQTAAQIEQEKMQAQTIVNVVIPQQKLGLAYSNSRSLLSVSSCGICGKTSLEEIKNRDNKLDDENKIDINLIHQLFKQMQTQQHDFQQSGGTHAAAAFCINGKMLCSMEDIGRHNAVDKVIGKLIFENQLKEAKIITVSGRISYEIVIKCFKAGIPFLAAVSAPSSLAVDYAKELGITLFAFCRGSRATCYSNPHRTKATNTHRNVN